MSKTIGHRRKPTFKTEMWSREASETGLNGWNNTKETRRISHHIKRQLAKRKLEKDENDE